MDGSEIVLSLRAVRKDYHSLRPLRVERFELRRAETVALLGVDRAAAEVLVNLVTAATLPDAGDVDVFGVPTRDITDPDAWLRLLDRFGILSERVVLLDELTVEQNLVLPLSLELHDIPPDISRTVTQLADESGIAASVLAEPMARVDAMTRARVRLAKALAPGPQVLLAEHPNASLAPTDAGRFASDLSGIAAQRGLAMLVLTADAAFAHAACSRVMALAPATGRLEPPWGWRWWRGRG